MRPVSCATQCAAVTTRSAATSVPLHATGPSGPLDATTPTAPHAPRSALGKALSRSAPEDSVANERTKAAAIKTVLAALRAILMTRSPWNFTLRQFAFQNAKYNSSQCAPTLLNTKPCDLCTLSFRRKKGSRNELLWAVSLLCQASRTSHVNVVSTSRLRRSARASYQFLVNVEMGHVETKCQILAVRTAYRIRVRARK